MNKKILLSFILFLIITILIYYNKQEANIDYEINKYICNNCKMMIIDNKFKYQIITKKGKSFKFDDINCLIKWLKEKKEKTENCWGKDYLTGQWINLNDSIFYKDELIKTPMNSQIIITKNNNNIENIKTKKGYFLNKEELINEFNDKK